MQPQAIAWVDGRSDGRPAVLRLLDQTRLPHTQEYLDVTTVADLVDAVQRLAVRGAPALGGVGALGVVIAMDEAARSGWSPAQRDEAIAAVRNARPTAVNLAWGVDEVLPHLPQGRDAVLAAAVDVVRADGEANRELSRLGAKWLRARVGVDRPLRVLTHCNTGVLATTSWGTALGIVRQLAAERAIELVYVDETRPLLQGARLTAWELAQEQIPYVVQADGAAASTILRGLVDAVLIGADRIARSGDTANKIGSVGLALAAREAGIPFVVAAPWSTVDLATADGSQIHIEMRDGAEVCTFLGTQVCPPGAVGFNPAFDVTPARLIDAVVTERGVVCPNRGEDLSILAGQAQDVATR